MDEDGGKTQDLVEGGYFWNKFRDPKSSLQNPELNFQRFQLILNMLKLDQSRAYSILHYLLEMEMEPSSERALYVPEARNDDEQPPPDEGLLEGEKSIPAAKKPAVSDGTAKANGFSGPSMIGLEVLYEIMSNVPHPLVALAAFFDLTISYGHAPFFEQGTFGKLVGLRDYSRKYRGTLSIVHRMEALNSTLHLPHIGPRTHLIQRGYFDSEEAYREHLALSEMDREIRRIIYPDSGTLPNSKPFNAWPDGFKRAVVEALDALREPGGLTSQELAARLTKKALLLQAGKNRLPEELQNLDYLLADIVSQSKDPEVQNRVWLMPFDSTSVDVTNPSEVSSAPQEMTSIFIAELKGQVSSALVSIGTDHTAASRANGRAQAAVTAEDLAALNAQIANFGSYTATAKAERNVLRESTYNLIEGISSLRTEAAQKVAEIETWKTQAEEMRNTLYATLADRVNGSIGIIRGGYALAKEAGRNATRAADEAGDLLTLDEHIGSLNTHAAQASAAQTKLNDPKYDLIEEIDALRAEARDKTAEIKTWQEAVGVLRNSLYTRLSEEVEFSASVIENRHWMAQSNRTIADVKLVVEDLAGLDGIIAAMNKEVTEAKTNQASLNEPKYDLIEGIGSLRTEAARKVAEIEAVQREIEKMRSTLIAPHDENLASLTTVTIVRELSRRVLNGRVGEATGGLASVESTKLEQELSQRGDYQTISALTSNELGSLKVGQRNAMDKLQTKLGHELTGPERSSYMDLAEAEYQSRAVQTAKAETLAKLTAAQEHGFEGRDAQGHEIWIVPDVVRAELARRRSIEAEEKRQQLEADSKDPSNLSDSRRMRKTQKEVELLKQAVGEIARFKSTTELEKLKELLPGANVQKAVDRALSEAIEAVLGTQFEPAMPVPDVRNPRFVVTKFSDRITPANVVALLGRADLDLGIYTDNQSDARKVLGFRETLSAELQNRLHVAVGGDALVRELQHQFDIRRSEVGQLLVPTAFYRDRALGDVARSVLASSADRLRNEFRIVVVSDEQLSTPGQTIKLTLADLLRAFSAVESRTEALAQAA